MKRLYPILILLIVGGAASYGEAPSLQPSDLLIRAQFVGFNQLATDTNAAKITEIRALPATRQLGDKLSAKLALAPFQLLQARLGGLTNPQAALFQPLFEDLLNTECCLEAREQKEAGVEWTFGLRLNAERAQVWSTNLWQALANWRAGDLHNAKLDDASGWELKKTGAPNRVRLVRSGEWTVIAVGQNELPTQELMLKQIKKNGHPAAAAKKDWFELYAHLPKLAALAKANRWLASIPANLPTLNLLVNGQTNNLRSQLKMAFAKPLNWEFEAWQIPTNTVHDPLASFTAVRGFRAQLEDCDFWKSLAVGTTPNQYFAWSYMKIPFQICAAMPMADPTNAMAQLEVSGPRWVTNHYPRTLTPNIVHPTNRVEALWQGLPPMLVPFLRPEEEAAGTFLVAGTYPALQVKKPMPEELIATILGQTNLVYYGWEITQERVMNWSYLSQLLYISTHLPARPEPGKPITRPPKPPESIGRPWLTAIAPELGNTVTEVSLTAPQELTAVRKSHIGLSGFELFQMGRWFDSTNFPFCGFQLPAQPAAGK